MNEQPSNMPEQLPYEARTIAKEAAGRARACLAPNPDRRVC
jgi:hypothetical protein